ncbi:hypothetical protein JCGZ_12795 [Jatropha curcas]|uniref:Uncharacterized protein n=1 Tax=Jatropha curcas TaxID=180498 RepID=A0A067KQ56_JATCU|nr:hypothetical protein JCGZ_12795 [Jatropha curcas]
MVEPSIPVSEIEKMIEKIVAYSLEKLLRSDKDKEQVVIEDEEAKVESERKQHVDDTWQDEEFFSKKMPTKRSKLELVISDTDPPSIIHGAQEHNMGNPLVLPSGLITRSHTKRYGAAMSLYVQDQVTQELHDLAFNKCCVELEGTPRLLTLLEAYVDGVARPGRTGA